MSSPLFALEKTTRSSILFIALMKLCNTPQKQMSLTHEFSVKETFINLLFDLDYFTQSNSNDKHRLCAENIQVPTWNSNNRALWFCPQNLCNVILIHNVRTSGNRLQVLKKMKLYTSLKSYAFASWIISLFGRPEQDNLYHQCSCIKPVFSLQLRRKIESTSVGTCSISKQSWAS